MTKYVGARYMPKFMGPHDATTAYEALSVVDNGMGTSYVANKPVPVGIPLTDTEYWVVYGSTNGAIINLQDQINDMQDGTIPGSLQNQIDDTNTSVQALYDLDYLANKNILIIGDSLEDEAWYAGRGETCWVTPFKSKMTAINTNVDNKSQSGRKMVDVPGHVGDFYTAADDYDIIIVALGTNDWYNTPATELEPYTYGSLDPTHFQGAIAYTYIQIMSVRNDKVPDIWFITPPAQTLQERNSDGNSLDVYRKAIEGWCHSNNCGFIDGSSVPKMSYMPVFTTSKTLYQPDGIHFSTAYANIYCDYITDSLRAQPTRATSTDGVICDYSSHLASGITGSVEALFDGNGDATLMFSLSGTFAANDFTVMSTLPTAIFKKVGLSAFWDNISVYDTTSGTAHNGLIYENNGELKIKLENFTSSFNFMIRCEIKYKCSTICMQRKFS